MSGWKTWLAAIGAMATGIALVAAGILSDPLDGAKIQEGILVFLGGLAMIGIGHKIEKAVK